MTTYWDFPFCVIATEFSCGHVTLHPVEKAEGDLTFPKFLVKGICTMILQVFAISFFISNRGNEWFTREALRMKVVFNFSDSRKHGKRLALSL